MSKHNELRKVAVLISSLEEGAAEALLAKFPPAQAGEVRRVARELGEISPEERRRALRDFAQATGADADDEASGVELDFSLADKLEYGYEDPPVALVTPPAAEAKTPFQFLHEARVEQLVRLLSGERPQLIALVMAHLPAEKAAATLGRFHKSQQAEVLTRLAELDDASPEALAEIELELQELLQERHRVTQSRAAGFAAVSAILGAAGASDRQTLLTSLADSDSKLLARLGYPTTDQPLAELAGGHAEAIRRAMQHEPAAAPHETGQAHRESNARLRFGLTTGSTRLGGDAKPAPQATPVRVETPPVDSPEPVAIEQESPSLGFEDLRQFDDNSLACLFARADRHVLRLALSGAEEALIARMTAGLSRGESRGLRRQLVAIGPVRLSDMEAAQEELAALAQRLCRSGEISPPTASTTMLAG